MNEPLGVQSINPRLHCASAAIATTWNTALANLILRLPLSCSLTPAARQAAADWQEKQLQRQQQQQQQQHPFLLLLLLSFLSSPLRLSHCFAPSLSSSSTSYYSLSLSFTYRALLPLCFAQQWCKTEWKTKSLHKRSAILIQWSKPVPLHVQTSTPNKP